MSTHAFPYNDDNGDREYDAESFSDWLKKFFTNGVFNGELQVTAAGGMVVTVAEGTAQVGGKVKDFNATNFTVATANSQYPRIDTIVMERNDTDRDFSLKYVQGQYSSSTPSPTAPVRADGVYQLVLAQIYVDAGVTGITQADITDTRTDTDLCGWVVQAVQTVDFEQFTAQFEEYFAEFEAGNLAEFEAWFDHMKDQLSEDAAGHLQQEIDDMDELVYTSSDDLDPSASVSVELLASGETQVSRWEKVSKMFKNIRYLLKTMGNTDISAIGDGTATGALSAINTYLSERVVFTNKSTTAFPSQNISIANLQDYKYARIFYTYGETLDATFSIEVDTSLIGRRFPMTTTAISTTDTYMSYRDVTVGENFLSVADGYIDVDGTQIQQNNLYCQPRKIILHN